MFVVCCNKFKGMAGIVKNLSQKAIQHFFDERN